MNKEAKTGNRSQNKPKATGSKKGKAPKVSVVSISYNQKHYIEAALKGFMDQITDFDFEVIIADDSSSDGTADIIRKYAREYPGVIKPVLRKKNIGVKDNLDGAFQEAKGEYIAICEGDDYWTDPHKLQMQADFLDSHPDFALCFHPVRVFFQDGEEPDSIYPEPKKGAEYTVADLLRGNFIQTNSVMYRREGQVHLPDGVLPLDWYVHAYYASLGKIGFIDRVMADYRRHHGGIWWSQHRDLKGFWRKYGLSHLRLYTEFLNFFGSSAEYRSIISSKIGTVITAFAEEPDGMDLIEKAVEECPKALAAYISEMSVALDNKEKAVSHAHHEIQEKDALIAKREDEIRWMKNSKFWKLRNMIANMLGRE